MPPGLVPKEMAEFYELQQSDKAKRWEAQGRKCFWCKCNTVLTRHSIPNQATDDHVHPRGLGGSNEPENIVSACLRCNARRSAEQGKKLAEGALMGKHNRKYDSVSGSQLREEMYLKEATVARDSFRNVQKQRDEYREFVRSFTDNPFKSAILLTFRKLLLKLGIASSQTARDFEHLQKLMNQ